MCFGTALSLGISLANSLKATLCYTVNRGEESFLLKKGHSFIIINSRTLNSTKKLEFTYYQFS